MDAVLRNFKNIPCPAGDKCTRPNCQWRHSWDTDAPVSGRHGGEDQLGPRKRLKVESGEHTLPPEADQTKVAAITTKKSVSPPPLKRKAPPVTNERAGPKGATSSLTPPRPPQPSAHSKQPLSTQSTASSAKPLAAPITTPVSNGPSPPLKKPAPKAARKPEPLNPRHLKSSPATHEFRFKALTMLHEQLVRLNNELKKDASNDEGKLILSDQQLIWMALDEEEKLATDKPPIYSNIIKNHIMSYKRMSIAKWKEEREAERKKEVSAISAKISATPLLGPPKVIQTGLTPKEEVAFLSRLLTPINELQKYGYVPSVPAEKDIQSAREADVASRGWETCDRCSSRFQVFPGRREDGSLTSYGKCTYHSGKPYYPEKQQGDKSRPQRRWRCCKEAVGDSPGCTKAETHVFKITHPARLAAVMPFVETPPNPLAPKDRAVCFDCEMGYTVRGLELIRLTATSWPDGKELLDVLVHPLGEILDLNSRYSGVWPEDIVNAVPFSLAKRDETPSPEQLPDEGTTTTNTKKKKPMQIVSSPAVARDLLFSLISPSTPLIGHGLENDLNAVRVVHPTLVDTVLLYPHARGLPIRHGLKALTESLLNRAIQVEAAEGERPAGHDSAEDARAAGDLVRLKVQEEWARLRRLGWVLVDGVPEPSDLEAGGGGRKGGVLTEEFLEKKAAGGATGATGSGGDGDNVAADTGRVPGIL